MSLCVMLSLLKTRRAARPKIFTYPYPPPLPLALLAVASILQPTIYDTLPL